MNKIKAIFQQMTDSEIREIIPAQTLERIKLKDPHPMFKAFCVGHTGLSSGQLGSGIPISVQYFKEAIRLLSDKIRAGLPLFFGHPKRGEGARVSIGEVVGRKLIELEDGARSIIIGYIYPQFKEKELDIASLEGNMLFQFDKDGIARVKDIQSISGIALASSQGGTIPGFPGATLLGAFQAFQKKGEKENDMPDEITLDQVKEFIEDGGFQPSDLFGKDKLVLDKTVKESIQTAKRDERGFGTRKEKELNDLKEEMKVLKEAHTSEVNTLRIDLAKYQTAPLFDAEVVAAKLDDKKRAWIEKRKKNFKPSAIEPDKIKAEVQSFLKESLADFEEFSQIVNPQKDTDKKDEKTPDDKTPENPFMP